jgi:hypothetical protein
MLSMKAVLRRVASIAAGVVAFLASAVSSCDDVAGSDWDRCQSLLGNPILELPGVWSFAVPALIGAAVGWAGYVFLGFIGLRDRSDLG